MPSFRPIVALLMTLVWVVAVLHIELEANGLLPAHSHHTASHGHEHGAAAADQHHHHSTVTEEHESVAARGVPGFAHLLLLLAQLATSVLPLVGLWLLGALVLRLRRSPALRLLPRPETWTISLPSWSFSRRCAGDSLAPPLAA